MVIVQRNHSSRYKALLTIATASMLVNLTQVLHQTQNFMDAVSYPHILTSSNYFVEFKARSLLRDWQNNAQSIVDKIKPLPQPDATSPFVFFHNRKCGGSSLRWIIYNATKKLGIQEQSWIPCCTEDCVPYSLPPHKPKKAVYASHVNYVSLLQTLREAPIPSLFNVSHEPLTSGKTAQLHSLQQDEGFGGCITNLRSTIRRVVSCWNFRMVEERMDGDIPPLPPAKKMSATDWANLLPKAYDQYSNGCNNEVFRIMGSSIDETYINTMSPSQPSFLYEFNKTAHHLSKCIIVMGERCEESNMVLRHYLPWLGNVNLCDVSVQSSKLNEKSKMLQPNASEVILQYNRMDDLLFQFGETLFELQLNAAMNDEMENDDLMQFEIF